MGHPSSLRCSLYARVYTECGHLILLFHQSYKKRGAIIPISGEHEMLRGYKSQSACSQALEPNHSLHCLPPLRVHRAEEEGSWLTCGPPTWTK